MLAQCINLVASTSIDVSLNGSNIKHVADFKLLGIKLDQDLSFNRQIEELCKKLAKRIGLLRHGSPYLKRNQRDIYYSTIIKPVMLYSSTIWTSCSKENLLKVLRLQKRAARIILDAERTAPSVDLFNTLKRVPFYAESYVNRLRSKAKFRRRTSHEPSRMQMRKILCSPSLAFDSAHVKYGVLKGEFHGSAHARILTGLCTLSGTGPGFSLFMNQS